MFVCVPFRMSASPSTPLDSHHPSARQAVCRSLTRPLQQALPRPCLRYSSTETFKPIAPAWRTPIKRFYPQLYPRPVYNSAVGFQKYDLSKTHGTNRALLRTLIRLFVVSAIRSSCLVRTLLSKDTEFTVL
jgi:hypothetical protein